MKAIICFLEAVDSLVHFQDVQIPTWNNCSLSASHSFKIEVFSMKKMWLLQLVTQTIIQVLFLLTPLHLGCSRLILCVISILSQKY